jgi:hypothetical protein
MRRRFVALLNKKSWIGLAIILIAVYLSGCGPSSEETAATNTPIPSPTIQITKTPAETAAPTTLEILKAMTPDYQVYFDGEECIVEGPSELNTGEYLFILHNQTDLPAILVLGSYSGEGTVDDHLYWLDYRLYDITMERQYLIEVFLDGYWGWLCAPIQVSNSP